MEDMSKKHDFKFLKEATLELIQLDSGEIVLRHATEDNDNEDAEEALVSINFSDQIKDLLGDDLQQIGQHMVHSAIQMLMHQQVANWHANVVDEEPTNYS